MDYLAFSITLRDVELERLPCLQEIRSDNEVPWTSHQIPCANRNSNMNFIVPETNNVVRISHACLLLSSLASICAKPAMTMDCRALQRGLERIPSRFFGTRYCLDTTARAGEPTKNCIKPSMCNLLVYVFEIHSPLFNRCFHGIPVQRLKLQGCKVGCTLPKHERCQALTLF
jgi:hypothetical protein